MESSLHRELKARYCGGTAGQLEVREGAYRADAVLADGSWLEVQAAALAGLSRKLERLLPARAIRVVKPVVVERRIVRVDRGTGRVLSTRRSPRRGMLVEVFDELVSVARHLGHPHLRIDVVGVSIEEQRVASRKRRGYAVLDRRLIELREEIELSRPSDLWRLLPEEAPRVEFTTRELDVVLARGRAFAQRVAYCLRLSGAVTVRGKRGNCWVYDRVDDAPRDSAGPGGIGKARRSRDNSQEARRLAAPVPPRESEP
jgi:hypothetical protein